MSKWRPTDNCLYVIPDIHGMYNQLELILSRILPLRKTDKHTDRLIFLGDYIDRGELSHKVIDTVLKIKTDAPDQIITLLGNHELMIQEAMKPNASLSDYNMWMHNGGENTLIGYLKREGLNVDSPYCIPRHCISSHIPAEHKSFFESLQPYYETDDCIFVHGGCDPFVPLNLQKPDVLAWDRTLYQNMWNLYENKVKCPWEKIIVTGHNGEPEGKPFIHDKYMMLDGSQAERLYVWEINSMAGFYAQKSSKRLVKESSELLLPKGKSFLDRY